jgi:hypothetical protein
MLERLLCGWKLKDLWRSDFNTRMRWSWRVAWLGFLLNLIFGFHGVLRILLIIVFGILLTVEISHSIYMRGVKRRAGDSQGDTD